MNEELKNALKNIRLLASDFDGVMTDGYAYMNEQGIESVRCSRRDSLGMGMLKKEGILVIVISKEVSPVVAARCKKINIECYQGVERGGGKVDILKEVLKKENLSPDELVYVGDDVNDKDAFEFAGVAITVNDGHPILKEMADYVTKANGGEHAIREICELILKAKGIPICWK